MAAPRPVAQFQNNFTEMFLLCLFTKFLKWFHSAEKVAARAKNRKKIKQHLSQLPNFQNNFTEMFLLRSFTKIGKMRPLQ